MKERGNKEGVKARNYEKIEEEMEEEKKESKKERRTGEVKIEQIKLSKPKKATQEDSTAEAET